MKNPPRISIALDEETNRIFTELRGSFTSVSEMFRELLRFYSRFRFLENQDPFRIKTYVEMLSEGEHVILDIDHWVAFLRFMNTHPEKERFWEVHERIPSRTPRSSRGGTRSSYCGDWRPATSSGSTSRAGSTPSSSGMTRSRSS
ncbi:hypothetical protein GAH_01768 [Geoglobus ahangari]|uniref:Ribbon-helix-helix protein CopG domain-containing protein n=1 Tax=Geoglobus ahangari TaxID=113653 RepID=A0A0F7IDG1_9EURY|nr:hypothetical protein [Geoglobus ahangari]AKG90953.1 hypothetical protein GAH_01768 [Geoglobus ahangari]